MTIAKQLRQAVGEFPAHQAGEMGISSVCVFLYRDEAPRPKQSFWPCHVHHNPASPYHLEIFWTPNKVYFELFTDQHALEGDKPLWFHIDVMGIGFKPFAFISFHKTGGGGTPRLRSEQGGSENQKSGGSGNNLSKCELRNQKKEKGRAKRGNRRRGETRDLLTSLPPDFDASAADLATLRALFDALRAFPEGWERSSTPFPTGDEETEENDHASST